MTEAPTPAEIAQVDAFAGLDADDLRRIAQAGTRVTLPADWSLIWEKTPADKAYILLDGEVAIRRGREEVARLGPGNVVGEAAIVHHRLRNAAVVTRTPVSVLHYTREAVERLCRELPAFEAALQESARGRVGETASQGS